MPNGLQDAVERAVAQVLEDRLPALRAEIAGRVLEAVTRAMPGDGTADQLNEAFTAILQSTSQADILAALLDGMARSNSRVALFVLRGGVGQGWQARGFDDDETIKTTTVSTDSPLAARAVQTRLPATGSAGDFDPGFATAFGAPAEGSVLVLPLVVRDKVAALLYVDAGTRPGGRVSPAAAELLVRAAAVWIELVAVRKPGGARAAETASAGTAQETLATDVGPPPRAASAAAAAAATLPVEPVPTAGAEPAGAARSPEEEALHRKARRFAKLLVEEIKLYNQAKVAEGQDKGDLWDRLNNEILKSRASYDKRYAQTAVASADYFTRELIRTLANGNVALLGSNFPG